MSAPVLATASRELVVRIEALTGDERQILDALLGRLEVGRDLYGPWDIRDGRDYPAEAFEELIDGLHYCAAELVRRRRLATARRRRIYVCHPYANDPEGNVARVRVIARALVAEGALPIAPHLYLPAFLEEATERDLALSLCLELVELCDELRVFGSVLTPGMRRELARARELGVPVRFVEVAS